MTQFGGLGQKPCSSTLNHMESVYRGETKAERKKKKGNYSRIDRRITIYHQNIRACMLKENRIHHGVFFDCGN